MRLRIASSLPLLILYSCLDLIVHFKRSVLIVFCICGLIIIFYFNSILTSIIGFSLLGLGISNIIPLAYSISGKIDNIDSAVSISIISISAYGVFMGGPDLMGLIANNFGISYVFLPLIFFQHPTRKKSHDVLT